MSVLLCCSMVHLLLSVLFAESHAGTANITAAERGNVTLQLEDAGPKQDVAWVFSDGNHFATTKPNEQIAIRDPQYGGRLHALKDGSLLITQLTLNDRGVYRAKMRLTNGSTIGQNFNVTIMEYSSPSGASSMFGSAHLLPLIPSLWLLMNTEEFDAGC